MTPPRPVLTLAAVALTGVLTGCAQQAADDAAATGTTSAAASSGSPVTAPPGGGGDSCPERASDPEDLVDRAQPPDGSRALYAATLCRYEYHDDHSLHLVPPLVQVEHPTAGELWEEHGLRSPGMVDCEPTPERGLFAVLDRDADGTARVVTVDLGLCASVATRVGEEHMYGLATPAHVRLLRETWAAR